MMFADRNVGGATSAKFVSPSLNFEAASASISSLSIQPQAQMAYKPAPSAPAVADGRDFSGTNNQVSTVD